MINLKNKITLLLLALFVATALVTTGSLISGSQTVSAETTTASQSYDGKCNDTNINKDNCAIIAYLVDFIRILSGLVGVVVVIMITVGGIQYSTARDNPQATAAAKDRITNAILALVFYLFIFAFLQYIVPGGVL